MTLRHACGWESGSTGQGFATSGGVDALHTDTRGYWSAYAAHIEATRRQHLGVARSEWFAGFAVRFHGSGDASIFAFEASDATAQASVGWDANTGQLVAYRGDGATELGRTAKGIPPNQWRYVEWHLVISDTAGVFEIRVDEELWLSLTGVDTKEHASEATAEFFRVFGASSFARQRDIDDLVVLDTDGTVNSSWPGDTAIEGLQVTANGDVTQLSRGGTDSGANWSQVDEVPASDADYVFSSTPDQRDLYVLEDMAAELTDVRAVVAWLRAQKTDAGPASIAHVVKYDSNGDAIPDTESTGPDHPLTVGVWRYFERLMESQPDGSSWTRAKVNALQLGAKVR